MKEVGERAGGITRPEVPLLRGGGERRVGRGEEVPGL
jgi:hypothetical protein